MKMCRFCGFVDVSFTGSASFLWDLTQLIQAWGMDGWDQHPVTFCPGKVFSRRMRLWVCASSSFPWINPRSWIIQPNFNWRCPDIHSAYPMLTELRDLAHASQVEFLHCVTRDVILFSLWQRFTTLGLLVFQECFHASGYSKAAAYLSSKRAKKNGTCELNRTYRTEAKGQI